VEQETNTP